LPIIIDKSRREPGVFLTWKQKGDDLSMITPAEHHAARVKRNMQQTMANIVRTNSCIASAEDKRIKAQMKARNDRRHAALEQMQQNLNPPMG